MTENQTCFDHGRRRRSWVKITNIWQLSSSRIKGRREGKARVVGTKKSTVSNPLSIFPPWTIFSTKLRDNWGEVKIHCVMFFYWKKNLKSAQKENGKTRLKLSLFARNWQFSKVYCMKWGMRESTLGYFAKENHQKKSPITAKIDKDSLSNVLGSIVLKPKM